MPLKRRIAKHIVAVWFSMLLLLGNTPMEFIHSFADHIDTVHKEHKGLVIEKKHHHCAYLSLTLTSFINDYQLPFVIVSFPGYFPEYNSVVANSVQRAIIATSLRGPPSVV